MKKSAVAGGGRRACRFWEAHLSARESYACRDDEGMKRV